MRSCAQVQRVAALCSRIAALIAHEPGCADAMVAVCKRLSAQRLNRLQSTFDSLDLELVTDFIRIRIYGTAYPFAQPPKVARSATKQLHAQLQPAATHAMWGATDTALPPGRSERGRTLSSDSATTANKQQGQSRSCSPGFAQAGHNQQCATSVPSEVRDAGGMRVAQLRAAGHPLVHIADKMLVVRFICLRVHPEVPHMHASHHDATDQQAACVSFVCAVLSAVSMITVSLRAGAARLHSMLPATRVRVFRRSASQTRRRLHTQPMPSKCA